MHVLGPKWDHSNALFLLAGVPIAPSQRVQHSIGHEPCVDSIQPNWSCCIVHSGCSFNLETHLPFNGQI